MLSKKKWVATVRDNKWVVAKVSQRKGSLSLLRLEEFDKNEYILEEENNPTQKTTDSLRNESELDEEGVGQEDSELTLLKGWLKKNKIPHKKLQLAFSCPGVITRVITIPELKKKDLEKLLTQQVDQYFTLDVSDYVIDYRILEKVEEEGQKRLRVLLVAIPLPEWEKQWDLWTNIGFTPKVIDFAADCICRIYRRLSGWDDKKDYVPVSDIAILDLGKDRVEFVLMEHGVFFLYSDMEIDLGDLDFVEKSSLSSERASNSEPEDSEVAQEHNGNLFTRDVVDKVEPLEMREVRESEISSDFEGFQEYGTAINSEINKGVAQGQEEISNSFMFSEQRENFNLGENGIAQEQNELEDRLFPVFNALREFLNFFASRHFGKSVDQIFLTGECADYPGLEEIFERNTGIQTKVGFPNEWKPQFHKNLKDKEGQWMKYASLYGLAIRED